MKQKNRTNNSKKRIALVVILLLIIAGISAGLVYKQHHQQRQAAAKPKITDTINYAPPTKEEQSAGDSQKQQDLDQDAAQKPTNANVLISDANQYDDTIEVRAYVANVAENGGTCTTTFTQGSKQVTEKTNSFGDASTTQCGAIDLARSRFATSGTWNVSVSYSSSTISGQSSSTSFVIK